MRVQALVPERPVDLATCIPETKMAADVESFSDHERSLIEKTEEAIRDGSQLEQWYRQNSSNLDWFPLEIGKDSFRLSNRNEGFFGSLDINGQHQSVMGYRQEIELGQTGCATATKCLGDFVLGDFLRRAHWTHGDGSLGGFTVQQSLYKTIDGRNGRFSPEASKDCIDWRQLDTDYAWVLLTIEIHDFVLDFGPFQKHVREKVCVAPNPQFVHVVKDPSERDALEVSIGYPFVNYAPIPHHLGFGLGKFGTAIKLFSFFLSRQNKIRVRLSFAAAPRCQKVFDFGPDWPDPVYGSAELLEYLTLGHWHAGPFHDRLDAQMLAVHCQVHQRLIDGVERILENTEIAGLLRLFPPASVAETVSGNGS